MMLMSLMSLLLLLLMLMSLLLMMLMLMSLLLLMLMSLLLLMLMSLLLMMLMLMSLLLLTLMLMLLLLLLLLLLLFFFFFFHQQSILRTKQYMADAEYNHCLLYLPRSTIVDRLPAGAPAGREHSFCGSRNAFLVRDSPCLKSTQAMLEVCIYTGCKKRYIRGMLSLQTQVWQTSTR